MQRYIGLDVHAASCTAAIMDARGKRLGAHVVETNGEALVKFLTTQPGRTKVCMEEGTQSEWLYQVLSPPAEVLKMVFKGAATSILLQYQGSELHADYERMLAAGTKPNLAKVTLARKIAATALAMWKKKEAYDPEKRKSKTS